MSWSTGLLLAVFTAGYAGELKATLTITEAVSHDWESIAVAPCGEGAGGWCIYIADTGDVNDHRENVIYKVREPPQLRDYSLPILQKLHLIWHHPDSQCMMVDPTGNVYVVSHTRGGGLLGKIPSTEWTAHSVHITETQPVNINSSHDAVLGCDISTDGEEMVIIGREAIYYYAINNGDVLGAVKAQPGRLPYHNDHTGRGIAWTPSGEGYYTVAQHDHSAFYFYQRESPQTIAFINPPTTIGTTRTTTIAPHTKTTRHTIITPPTTTNSPAQTNPLNTPLFCSGQMTSSIKSTDLDGVSGLVASHLHSGIYYVHNDRGDRNRIFAVDPTSGDIKATYSIAGATNTDWEDIAVGPCPTGGSCIYIADTGGSGGPASNIIYMLKEPTEIKNMTLPLLDQLHFKWNERESECLMVDPIGNIYLISEALGGGKLAEVPLSAWSSATFSINQTQSLSFHTTHFDPLGCDLSVNGKDMLIKTLNNVYYYSIIGSDVFAAVQAPLASLPYRHEHQGKAIAWTPSGDGYYTVGEGRSLPFFYYQRQ